MKARCLRIAKWIIPGSALVLIPKCPVCLAGYIAIGTGIGFTVPMALHLRNGLLALCVLALAGMAAGVAWRRG